MLLPWLVILCVPFSLPSIYLATRLCRKRFLNSDFNQHVALMMVFSGKDNTKIKTWKSWIKIYSFSFILYPTLLGIWFSISPIFITIIFFTKISYILFWRTDLGLICMLWHCQKNGNGNATRMPFLLMKAWCSGIDTFLSPGKVGFKSR